MGIGLFIQRKEKLYDKEGVDHDRGCCSGGSGSNWHHSPRKEGVTMEERIDFIEELLLQAEQADQEKKIEMDRLRADQILAAISKLEEGMAEVTDLCEKELKLIEEYRANELARLDKKRSWLVFNLDGFMRSTGEKTLRLPHGSLKLRKGRDKVAVVALDEFLKIGPRLKLVRSVPEQVMPDIQAIVNHIKTTGEIPSGVQFIPADVRFSYTTNGGVADDTERERNETEG